MLNKKEITKLIAGISKKKQAVNDDIQTAIANIAGHAYEHGDVTGYDSLIAALKGTDLVLVVRHIRTYGFGLLDGKAGAFKLNKTMRDSSDFIDGQAVVDYIMSVEPWYTKQDSLKKVAAKVDALAQIKSLTTRITKGYADGNGKVIDLHAARIAIAELSEAVQATKIA